jgi:hypothetical protein
VVRRLGLVVAGRALGAGRPVRDLERAEEEDDDAAAVAMLRATAADATGRQARQGLNL